MYTKVQQANTSAVLFDSRLTDAVFGRLCRSPSTVSLHPRHGELSSANTTGTADTTSALKNKQYYAGRQPCYMQGWALIREY